MAAMGVHRRLAIVLRKTVLAGVECVALATVEMLSLVVIFEFLAVTKVLITFLAVCVLWALNPMFLEAKP